MNALLIRKKTAEDGTVTVRIEGDVPPNHQFSSSYVQQALAEGWMSMSKGALVIHTEDGDVSYNIASAPGTYGEGEDRRVQTWYELGEMPKVEG